MNTEQTLTYTQKWYRDPANRVFQIARVKARAEQLRPANGSYVYGIWSEKHSRYMYIGETKTALRIRIANHKLRLTHGCNSKLYRGIREQGWDTIRFDVLDDNPNLETEGNLVAKYKTFLTGWNSTRTGK